MDDLDCFAYLAIDALELESLEHLPLVRDQFATGRLSYSQVRAVTRVATESNESSLVDLAAASTAAQLEAICRGYRRSTEAAKESAQRRHVGRHLQYHYDDDGSLVGTFRLPAEDGALFAAGISRRTEREDVLDAETGGASDPFCAAQADALVDLVAAGTEAPDSDDDSQYLVNVIVEESVLAREVTESEHPDCTIDPPTEPGVCQIDDGPGLAAETARRIACDAAVIKIVEDKEGNVIDVGRRMRLPNRALRRALCKRRHHCQFPGCRRTSLQPHHLWHWTKGGPTNLDNLIGLCKRHHHRVHEGSYRIEIGTDGQTHFIHPGGCAIPAVPDVGPADNHPDPDVPPYESGWDGTRLRLGDVVDGLLQADGLMDPAAWLVSAETSHYDDLVDDSDDARGVSLAYAGR